MSTISFLSKPHATFDCTDTCRCLWQGGVRLLNKHTDLISSGGILVITTCLLAAKIFKNIPPLLPRVALIVYNFGGIIWLNVQMRDLWKSCQDLSRAWTNSEGQALLDTATKVFVKAIGVLLTCGIFGASVVAAVGFPHVALTMHLTMRPFSLTSLALTILTDISDYFANESLLRQIEQIEILPTASREVSKLMICFLEIIRSIPPTRLTAAWPQTRKLADHLVRQLDTPTIETFQESFDNKKSIENARIEALKLFYNVKDSLRNKQGGTKANLSLIVLGYISMALCRAFPDTVIDMTSRWSMSVLYTDELIRQKLFQSDLSSHLLSAE